jgi:hypothetical protein
MTPINDKPLRVRVMLDFDREELRKRLAEECEERISGQRRRLLGVQRRLLGDEWGILGDQWGKNWGRIGFGILGSNSVENHETSGGSAAKAASLKNWDLAFCLYHCSNDHVGD